MRKTKDMNALFISVAWMVAAAFSSCNKERELPINPNPNIIRYATDLRMASSIIGGTVLHSIYLPACYNKNPEKRYPVVYLLHGMGDNYQSWNDQWLEITSLINTLEGQGLEPMIYVMPDAYRTYYVNRHNGRYRYMDMLTTEFIPHIDKTYRTIANKDHRAAVGYSMGGYGAFILPSKNRDLFSVSVPLSMSFRTDEQYMTESPGGWNSQWGAVFGGEGETGEARLTDYYKANSPFHMFTTETASLYAEIDYFLDCGDDEEQLLVANDDLHVQMRDLGMAHEYRVRNGGHTSSYWRSGMSEVLPYIQRCFNNETYPTEENAAPLGEYSAVREEKMLAGVECEVFLPVGYAENPEKNYPALYFVHNGDDRLTPEDAIKVFNSVQTSKPFVMIACSAENMATTGTDLKGVITAAETQYRLLSATANRVGLGYKAGGKVLYEATLTETSPLSSLLLVDGTIPVDAVGQPGGAVFYYITLADMGVNYAGANALYKYCHKQGIEFEYRVYNGSDTRNSALYGLQSLKSVLGERIKTN